MAANSRIEWTDDTVNFWIGCQNVSPACDNCYAERDWSMTGRRKRVEWGPHGERSPTKDPAGQMRAIAARARREGRRRRVFVNSLSDWADNHNSIDPAWRAAIFDAARAHPELDILLLTKRPQNIARLLPADWGNGWWNVWLGATIENRQELKRRGPQLAAIPALVHFWSCEPLLEYLGDLDLGRIGTPEWIIAGGESGPGARPMHPDWVRSIRDQCQAAGVRFFFKQWGQWAPLENDADWEKHGINNAHHNIRLDANFAKVGKARAGRLLDGREWNDMPGGTS